MAATTDDVGGRAPVGGDDAVLPDTVEAIVVKEAKKGEDEKAKMEAYVAQCWRKVDTCVELIQESSDVSAMTDRIKATAVNKMRADRQPQESKLRRFVCIVYDLKSASEASSHPATRLPPLRGNGDHLKQCLRAALDAVDADDIPDRDMYLIFDGGRTGLKSQCSAGSRRRMAPAWLSLCACCNCSRTRTLT